MFNQELCFERLLFCTKLHNVTCQKWPAIESEWGRMKVRETISVQEHVVLANIKALKIAPLQLLQGFQLVQ